MKQTPESQWKQENQYNDIIHLEHPVSAKHPHLSMKDRAAQFSPFAALSGHSAAIDETAQNVERDVEAEIQRYQVDQL